MRNQLAFEQPIKGYEGKYKIDRNGNVFSLLGKSEIRKLKPGLSGKNYYTVSLLREGHQRTHTIHRLLAEAFIPNPNSYSQINHINGIKTDNRLENLEWCSPSYNISHSYKYLTRKSLDKPEHSHKSWKRRLEPEQALEIYKMKGIILQRDLAARFKVSKSCIELIHSGRTWKWLTKS